MADHHLVGGTARSDPSVTRASSTDFSPHVEIVPQIDRPWVVDEGSEGVFIVYGSLRAVRSDTAVRVAPDHFANRIASVIRTANGWWFNVEDGLQAYASSFMETPHRLGTFQRKQAHAAFSGMMTLVDVGNRVWRSEGTAPFAPVVLPNNLEAIDAAFLDDRHGTVILDGGTVVQTDDSGQTWHAPLLAIADAFALTPRSTSTWDVQTLHGLVTLGVQEQIPVVAVTPPAHASIRALSEIESVRLRAAVEDSLPSLVANTLGAWLGNTYVVIRDQHLVGLDQSTGRVHRIVPDALPEGCRNVRSWGTTLAVMCEESGLTILRLDPTTKRLAPVASDGIEHASEYNVLLSDDGLHALRMGSCENSERIEPLASDSPQEAVCVLFDGVGDWRTVKLSRPILDAQGLHGALVLFGGRGMHAVFDTEHISWTDLAMPPRESNPWLDLWTVSWTPTGALIAQATNTESPSFGIESGAEYDTIVMWPDIHSPPHVRSLPPRTKNTQFLDDTNGMATGTSLADVYRTTDGAQTWQQVVAPVDGLPTLVTDHIRSIAPLPGPRGPTIGGVYGEVLRPICAESGCVVYPLLLVSGWRDPVVPVPTTMAADHVRARLEHTEEPAAHWQCTTEPGVQRRAWHDEGLARPRPGTGYELSAAGLIGRIDFLRRNTSARLRWRAETAGDVSAGDLLIRSANQYVFREEFRSELWSASPSGALLEWCNLDETDCHADWITPQTTLHLTETVSQAYALESTHVHSVRTTPDGLAVLLRGTRDDEMTVYVTIEISTRGIVGNLRAWILSQSVDENRSVTLGTRNDHPVLIAFNRDVQPPVRVFPLSLVSPPDGESATALDAPPYHACAPGPPSPGTVGFDLGHFPGNAPVFDISVGVIPAEAELQTHIEIEEAQSHLCVRSVDQLWASHNEAGRREMVSVHMTPVENGILTGHADARRTRRPHRCVPTMNTQ